MTLGFGTDGLRGRVDVDLTETLANLLGRAAADVLGAGRWSIGRDTRESGPRLEVAVAEGLASRGATVDLLGVLPTPAIALMASRSEGCAVVVSASHNPWHDNGLKIFGPGGKKLTDDAETAIERRMDQLASGEEPISEGEVRVVETGGDIYVANVVGALEGRILSGLSVVLDCGHGAASTVAGRVFAELGAEVEVLHDSPDGRNINDGVGSTDPSVLAAKVVEKGADIGLAFDGDADRLIAVDGRGQIVDGDRLMCMFAIDLKDRARLSNDTLVVTVMSNLGLRRAMAINDIAVDVTPVGDRHVLASLADNGHSLGGEQSGHIIFADIASTGDGVLAGAMLGDLVLRSGRPLADISAEVMTRLPQVLVNVDVAERRPDVVENLSAELRAAERTLAGNGRILIRPSGTEPVVRVMVEAETSDMADAIAQHLAGAVARRFGRHPSR